MTDHESNDGDFARNLIWLLFGMTGGPLPPYLLEIVLVGGKSYYVHSANLRDDASRAIILNVYDMRAMGKEEETELQQALQKPGSVSTHPEELHPLLSVGRLRCNLNDIVYCIEWMRNRRWTLADFYPEARHRRLGFDTQEAA